MSVDIKECESATSSLHVCIPRQADYTRFDVLRVRFDTRLKFVGLFCCARLESGSWIWVHDVFIYEILGHTQTHNEHVYDHIHECLSIPNFEVVPSTSFNLMLVLRHGAMHIPHVYLAFPIIWQRNIRISWSIFYSSLLLIRRLENIANCKFQVFEFWFMSRNNKEYLANACMSLRTLFKYFYVTLWQSNLFIPLTM